MKWWQVKVPAPDWDKTIRPIVSMWADNRPQTDLWCVGRRAFTYRYMQKTTAWHMTQMDSRKLRPQNNATCGKGPGLTARRQYSINFSSPLTFRRWPLVWNVKATFCETSQAAHTMPAEGSVGLSEFITFFCLWSNASRTKKKNCIGLSSPRKQSSLSSHLDFMVNNWSLKFKTVPTL